MVGYFPKQKVTNQLQKLQILHPTKTLQRGYALLRKDGKILDSVGEVQLGDAVVIQLKDGVVNAQITNNN